MRKSCTKWKRFQLLNLGSLDKSAIEVFKTITINNRWTKQLHTGQELYEQLVSIRR